MAKAWDELTQPEKIEDLRNDVKAIFAQLHDLIETQSQLGLRRDNALGLLSDVSMTVKTQTQGTPETPEGR
jgi:hypothetical protein